jgi:hypothetical protein
MCVCVYQILFLLWRDHTRGMTLGIPYTNGPLQLCTYGALSTSAIPGLEEHLNVILKDNEAGPSISLELACRGRSRAWPSFVTWMNWKHRNISHGCMSRPWSDLTVVPSWLSAWVAGHLWWTWRLSTPLLSCAPAVKNGELRGLISPPQECIEESRKWFPNVPAYGQIGHPQCLGLKS